jgi:hypothetical protein
MSKKRVVVWLTDPQIGTLAKMSKMSLAPVSALVRQAVEEFLQKRHSAATINNRKSKKKVG